MNLIWQKLEYKYDKAAYKLRKLRDELYPVGLEGKCKILDIRVTVKDGSLYPDQINTTMGHMSPRNFIPVELAVKGGG